MLEPSIAGCKRPLVDAAVCRHIYSARLTEDLRRKRRTAFPGLRCLLEGVGELQHAEVVAVAADDLDSDRKPFGGEAGGDRDRRVAGDRDVVAALHPVEVVA